MRIVISLLAIAAVAALGLSAAGCTVGDDRGALDDGAPDAATSDPPADAPSDAAEGGGTAGGGDDRSSDLRPEVQTAVNDFAAAEGIEPGAVTVVEVTSVTWPDSALGCAAPGEMYAQALVPGYEVRLSTGTKTAVYHTNRGISGAIAVRRCGGGKVVAPSDDPVVLDRIRADLIDRLPAGTEPVLERSGPVASTSLVCPGTPDAPADPSALTVQLAVSEVVLRVGADRHVYRVWNAQFVYCGILSAVDLPGFGTPTAATH